MSAVDFKPGDRFEVKVGGRPFQTVIDEHGVQRFVENRILAKYVDENNHRWSNGNRDTYTLNDLSVDYHRGEFTLDEMLDFYTSIGYSVGGFADLSYFADMEIENPLWAD